MSNDVREYTCFLSLPSLILRDRGILSVPGLTIQTIPVSTDGRGDMIGVVGSIEWITFDCYGTLIDWEGGIVEALQPFIPTPLDRARIARDYITIEAAVEREGYRPYREVLMEASRRLMAALGSPLPPEHADALPRSLPRWRPFPEVPGALLRLQETGYRLAILSNVDRDLIAASILQLGIRPDLVVTAEDCRSYKPAPGHWQRFEQLSGSRPPKTVHVAASLYHDIVPAGSLGYRTVFINRHAEPVAGASPTRTLPDLARLPETLAELDSLP